MTPLQLPAPRYPLPCLFLQKRVTVCLCDVRRFHELEDERPTLLEVYSARSDGSSADSYSRVRAHVLFAEYPGLYSYWKLLSDESHDEYTATTQSIRWWVSQEVAIRRIATLSKSMGIDAASVDMHIAQHFFSEVVDALALPVELD